MAQNVVRKALYHLFTYLKYGHLGRGNRIPIPSCVMEKIREEYPDQNREFMGFCEDNGDAENPEGGNAEEQAFTLSLSCNR